MFERCVDETNMERGQFWNVLPETSLMSSIDPLSMDLVRELRLRHWSRQNYVPADSRKTTWHPVVLDEMCRRDQELQAEAPARPGTVVPASTDLETAVGTRSNVLMIGVRPEFDGGRPHESGWSFLPLDSTAHGEFYPINMGITRPITCIENVGSSLVLRFTCLTQIV